MNDATNVENTLESIAEHQLKVAEAYRDAMLHCRRFNADELDYADECATYAQKSLDSRNGVSRILNSVEGWT